MRTLPFACLLLGLVVPWSAWAVDGFQGAAWGTSPGEVRDLLSDSACKSTLKRSAGANLLVCTVAAGGLENAKATYTFRDDRLTSVEVRLLPPSEKAAWQVLDGLKLKYGEPQMSPNPVWPGERIEMNMRRSNDQWEVTVVYTDVAHLADRIQRESDAEDRAVRNAGEGL